MLKKKLIGFMLIGVILCSNCTTAFAATSNITTSNVSNEYSTTTQNCETQGLKTKVIKGIIKVIINKGDDVAKIIKKVAGSKVSKNFLKYHKGICKKLTPLLEWTEIPAESVYDAVYRGAKYSGASTAVAKNIANAIKQAFDLLVF